MTLPQMVLLRCQQCSATLHHLPGQPLARCAFCGSSYLVSRPPDPAARPAMRLVPFSLQPVRARELFVRWLGKGILRPGNLARASDIEEPKAVFVPVYLGQCRAHSNWTAEVEHRRVRRVDLGKWPGHALGDLKFTVASESETQALSGAHDAEYERVCVLASRGVDEGQFGSLSEFDWSKLAPVDAGLLGEAALEEPVVPLEEASSRMKARVQEAEERACAAMVPGPAFGGLKVNTIVDVREVELALVPIFAMGYTYQGKRFRGLVNGTTGRVAAEAPLSTPRLAVAGAALLGVPALILWFLWRRRL
ncbi:MAG: hypothetical protein HY815_01650 [Candidatus Riflebacteria bacterium]|nr:hypothetical protein [Candidatus Riflebacteria bacterium]